MAANSDSASGPTADFDARAATWDDDPSKVERAKAVAEAIAREVPLLASMRALEYGAGTGLLSFLLRDKLGEITLADVSDGMLDVARGKIAAAGDPRMHAVRLDLSAVTPCRAFDIVLLMTLHHIPDTDGILRRFHDVLAPLGVLCIADLDTEDGSLHGAGFDGHKGFDREALRAKSIAAGFAESASRPLTMRKEGGRMRTFPIS
jgi:2-polyprenyl-3-methyl-5-hydroxy-6-metoxy-1,4-benzoquinol methylase